MLALAGGLAVMGCGGGSDEGGGASPASHEERQAETEGRDGRAGESGQEEDAEGGTARAGEGERGGDGEPGESGSSSIVQSSDGGSISSSSNVSGRDMKTFSGTGSTNLSFNVEQPSRLVWTNSEGRRFSASGAGISIDSRAGRGEVALEAGDYDDVRVNGASWTIVVRPR